MEIVEDHPPEFAGFFEAARGGRLAFPRCESCGRFHWYPMKACPHCRSRDIAWRPVAGNGEIFSWTVVRHAFDPAYRDRLPYVIALVEFADAPGIRLVTNIEEADPESLRIGMQVRPVFRQDGLVSFRPQQG